MRWYKGETDVVAKRLLGKVLCRRLAADTVLRGIIVEVEAYKHRDDAASHSARGRTSSNASMFLPAGHLYVYPIHAKYCLNIVTEREGRGAAVLIRAVEPLSGLDIMLRNRGLGSPPTKLSEWRSVSTGPGRLCQAFGVDRELDGVPLSSDSSNTQSQPVWLENTAAADARIRRRTTARIGLSQAKTLLLRHFVDGNRFVSGLAREHSRPRIDTLG